MKTIGIIGGLGPEATIDYYKEILRQYNEIKGAQNLDYPEIIVYSVSLHKFISLLEKGQLDEAASYIAVAINCLKDAGADFAAISANTPHLLFSQIQSLCQLKLISIVESCAIKAKEKGVKKCCLIGTKFTMKADFYKSTFLKYGIEICVPSAENINFIHNKLFTELEHGIYSDETKRSIFQILKNVKESQGADSVILGCTEFPIMFPENSYFGIPFFNTTRIHVQQILKEYFNH